MDYYFTVGLVIAVWLFIALIGIEIILRLKRELDRNKHLRMIDELQENLIDAIRKGNLEVDDKTD